MDPAVDQTPFLQEEKEKKLIHYCCVSLVWFGLRDKWSFCCTELTYFFFSKTSFFWLESNCDINWVNSMKVNIRYIFLFSLFIMSMFKNQFFLNKFCLVYKWRPGRQVLLCSWNPFRRFNHFYTEKWLLVCVVQLV